MAPVSTDERRHLLNQLTVHAQKDLRALWDQAGGAEDFAGTVTDTYPTLVDSYTELAGNLAATWFEEAAPGSDYQATVADPPPEDQLRTSAQWALGGDGEEGLARLEGSMQRAIYDGARDTTLLNVRETGGHWAREAEPDACDFCQGLEGDYSSDEAAAFEAHDHCQCMAVEVRDNETSAPDTADTINRGNPYADMPPSMFEQDSVRRRTMRRQEFLKATTLDEVDAAARNMGVRADFSVGTIPGDMADPQIVESAKRAVFAVDDVQQKYPNVKIESLGWGNGPETVMAVNNHLGGENYIAINKTWLNDPEGWQISWDQQVYDGFHYQGDPSSPAYNVTMHELGHGVANIAEANGAEIDAGKVDRALLQYWSDTHPEVQSIKDDNELADAFFTWKQEQMSGYSFTNTGEAIAEAFADVEINGEQAHESSKVIHAMLIDGLDGKPFKVPTDGNWPIRAAADKPPPMNYEQRLQANAS